MTRPILRTRRLTLRPFTLDDAPIVQQLAGEYEIALNTLMIPHPYPDGAAADWIASHDDDHRENRIHHFAIDDGSLCGAIALVMKDESMAEIGYWLGKPYWNRGYVSEAARELVRHGFEDLGLRRIFAGCFKRNVASARVMEKAGLTYEGMLRHHMMKWGEPQDVTFYGVLRDEWLSAR
ncbi:MAG: GNAT family N-acetyltransferase [Thermoanaerobaculia bacterium]